ncbi:hypothetical protein ACTFIW_003929 [Dictyostelium discoideum]
MEILKSKLSQFSSNNNIKNNKKVKNVELQFNDSNNLFNDLINENDIISSKNNYKMSDYKLKRNKYPGQIAQLIQHQQNPSLIVTNKLDLPIPLNQTSSSSTGGPPPIKKVISYCLSESIDLMGCFDLLENKGFKPQPFKNLFFFFIKKQNNNDNNNNINNNINNNNNNTNINNNSISHQNPNNTNYCISGEVSPRIMASSSPNEHCIEMNRIGVTSPNLYGFSLDHQKYYQQPQPQFSSYPTSPKVYKMEEFEKNHSLIVVYENGVVVCWDLPDSLQYLTFSLFDEFLINPLSSKLIDEMTFEKGYEGTHFSKDQILLQDHHFNTKLAISHSLSQSIRLSLIEENINKLHVITKNIPSQLVKKGSAGITNHQLSIIVGNSFKIKNSLSKNNLIFKSIVIDYFDKNDSSKTTFQHSSNYLDIKERTQSLNHSIKTINEMVSICRSELESKSSYRLEMTVIVLIFFELLFMILQFVCEIDKI